MFSDVFEAPQDSALGAVGLGGGQASEAMQNYQAQETLLAERLKAQKEVCASCSCHCPSPNSHSRQQLLPKINLEDLVKQINPNQKLDGEVEEVRA